MATETSPTTTYDEAEEELKQAIVRAAYGDKGQDAFSFAQALVTIRALRNPMD